MAEFETPVQQLWNVEVKHGGRVIAVVTVPAYSKQLAQRAVVTGITLEVSKNYNKTKKDGG